MDAILKLPDGSKHKYNDLISNDPVHQAILQSLNHQDGRAACTCNAKGQNPGFYVTNRYGRYILARMPGTSEAHHILCSLFQTPTLTSPSQSQAVAVVPGGWCTRLSTDDDERIRVMGLKGVLGTMIEGAGFHNWWPKSKGRRRYRQLHKFLMSAAEHIYLGKYSLAEHIFIPEAWSPDKASGISVRMNEAFDNIKGTDSPEGIHLIAGIVRKVRWMSGGFGYLELSGLPKFPGLYIPPELGHEIRDQLDGKLDNNGRSRAGCRCLALMAVHPMRDEGDHPDRLHKARIVNIGLQMLSPQYIPVESDDVCALVRTLVRQNRAFSVSLAYDDDYSNVVWLRDTGSKPIPLTIGSFAPDSGWLWNPEESPLMEEWTIQQSGPWPAFPAPITEE